MRRSGDYISHAKNSALTLGEVLPFNTPVWAPGLDDGAVNARRALTLPTEISPTACHHVHKTSDGYVLMALKLDNI